MEKKIDAVIHEMTLEEKVSQLLHNSPAIERLDIPSYHWWNEALHGVARAGVATIFPQAIALAACFDPEMINEIASAIALEGRAKFNEDRKAGINRKYHGLSFWSPNINIFRDPRWGRGQETFGEDPFLTSRLGTEFVNGLQGNDPENLKTSACAKHFAVHSGPEKLRHSFNAEPSLKDLHETYLPAFKALVQIGVESVMGAYSRIFGEPCCGSQFLMEDLLRKEWGFKGHYISDCWAIRDFHTHHGVTKSASESAALGLNKGCDLNCGCVYEHLVEAVKQGLVSEKKIDESLRRIYKTRYRLGILFQHQKSVYDSVDHSVIRSPEHLELSLKAARQSIVLLKNDNDLLPLNGDKKKLLLIGPGAANIQGLLANYHGLSPRLTTILEGLCDKLVKFPLVSMDYHAGSLMYSENKNNGWTVGMAENADIVIAVYGIDNAIEGEEGETIASNNKGDRCDIALPCWQLKYLKAIRERGTPLVLVLTGGSPVIVPDDIADAVLFVWYPGERGGKAVADVIFGEFSPSGKLPVTFPESVEHLPEFEDYSMAGRTYRYTKKEPQYPFGFGLSFSHFELGEIKIPKTTISRGESLNFSLDVINSGTKDSGQVIQVYIAKEVPSANDPRFSLRAFKRIHLTVREKKTLGFTLKSEDFESVNEKGEKLLIPGRYKIIVADSSPFSSALRKGAVQPVEKLIQVQ